MANRIDLATLCTCGHLRTEHRASGECNPCGSGGVGEDGYPNCAQFEAVADVMAQRQPLPRVEDGCCCTWYSEDRGGGYHEAMQEYDPACPVHSVHVYDPRLGEWVFPATEEQIAAAAERAIDARTRALLAAMEGQS